MANIKGGGVPLDYRGIWNKEWNTSGCDILCDICNIPVEDSTFDLIICFEVIEHLPEPLKAIKELSRLLKKDGQLVITAPNLCAVHQAPHFYYSGFSETFFRSAVLAKAPSLVLTKLCTEKNFTDAHIGELRGLQFSQNSKILRIFVFIYFGLTKVIFSILRCFPSFREPESCSGFFVIYKRCD